MIDAASFTAIRIVSGGAVLGLLLTRDPSAWRSGSWLSAAALATYAICFSFSYVRIDAGPGAFILFGIVQATMIGWSIREAARPSVRQWVGLIVAMAGLAWMTLPSASAPDHIGAGLMAIAGAAWGVYSLRGRGAHRPALATASNFVRAAPIVLVPWVIRWGVHHGPITSRGVTLALLSGVVTSGLGYVVWYAVVPRLGANRAAIAQLLVPVLAMSGGILLLGESPHRSVLSAAALILAGVLTALTGRRGMGPVLSYIGAPTTVIPQQRNGSEDGNN